MVISGCACLISILFFPSGVLLMLTPFLLTCATGCPDKCHCFPGGYVTCVGDTIADVPKQLPADTSLLQLRGTNLTVMKERSLAGLGLMLRFSLTHSPLHAVHPEAFRVAPQLISVRLSFNRLSALPPRVFSPLTQLEQLLLDGNRLEIIAPEMFEGLSNLKQVDLSQNGLGGLAAGVFDGLANLLYLNLGKNRIKKLPPGIFRPLTNLTTLLIYNNEIEALDAEMFDGLDRLSELKLHHNLIASLPPQVFWSLGKMNTLTLSRNRLQTIPERSFYHMPEMKQLTLYSNPLSSLPDQLMGHMPDLKQFYLYNTNLVTLPANLFANMSGMVNLSVHLNEELSELPPDLFCCLPNLDKLSLKSNNLGQLHPQLFSRLPTLSLLYLGDNKLRSLPEDIFRGLRNVSTIDLQNNHLDTLPGEIFASNLALESLDLSGNPWDCGCGIRGIATWIKRNRGVVVDNNKVICNTRDDRARRTLSSLSDDDFLRCHAPMHKSNLPTQTKPASGPQSALAPATAATTATPNTAHLASWASPVISLTTTPPPLRVATSGPPETDAVLPSEAPSVHGPEVFHHKMVLEAGPEYVHYSRHRGSVYIWFLPSSATFMWFLMFCHILLVVTGTFLFLATLHCLYRLKLN